MSSRGDRERPGRCRRGPGEVLATSLFAGVVLGAVGLGPLGCYNPQIESGALMCAPSGKRCPDGFVCDGASNRCVKEGAAGGSGGGGMTGGTGGGGAGGMVQGGAGGSAQCVGPLQMPVRCQADVPLPPGLACEPSCQRGCACAETCTVSQDGALCVSGRGGQKQLGEACDDSVLDCAPGNICLRDSEVRPACGAHCYRFCRVDADCPRGATCTVALLTRDGVGDIRICDQPPEACDPVFTRGNCLTAPGRDGNFACYIASRESPNLAVCDCQGMREEGQSCTHERDCVRGHVCVQAPGDAAASCRRVCPLTDPTLVRQVCGTAGECVRFARSERYGYCVSGVRNPL